MSVLLSAWPAPPPRARRTSSARITPAGPNGRVTTVTGNSPDRPQGRLQGVFDQAAGHEQVVFCHDEPTGLRAIIAIHSTALGPALGGTRFYPYASEADALADVLEPLARDVLQGRAGRPRPRWRQGRHHR